MEWINLEIGVPNERKYTRAVDAQFTGLHRQAIHALVNLGYGFTRQTAINVVNILFDSKQCVSVTVKRKGLWLRLKNHNFNRSNRLDSLKFTCNNDKTIDINLKIVDKSKDVENLKNILEIAEGRKPKGPKREEVVLDVQFVSRPWKPIELFEAMEGYGFDDKEVWSVFELMRDSEEIVQFQMENEEHRLTISDFRNPPYFPPRLGGVKW